MLSAGCPARSWMRCTASALGASDRQNTMPLTGSAQACLKLTPSSSWMARSALWASVSASGVTPEALKEAHEADLAIQDEEGVNFKHAWADPTTGMVFCLSEAPNAGAVQRIHERAGHPADQIYQVPVQV